MKEPKATIRDIIALPFSVIGFVFLILSTMIGGKFTSYLFLKSLKISLIERE